MMIGRYLWWLVAFIWWLVVLIWRSLYYYLHIIKLSKNKVETLIEWKEDNGCLTIILILYKILDILNKYLLLYIFFMFLQVSHGLHFAALVTLSNTITPIFRLELCNIFIFVFNCFVRFTIESISTTSISQIESNQSSVTNVLRCETRASR